MQMETRRKFSSYGPVDTEMNYFVPRTELIDKIVQQLIGENPNKNGHYFTVWAPRQTGKTWAIIHSRARISKDPRFYAVFDILQTPGVGDDPVTTANHILKAIADATGLKLPVVNSEKEFQEVFRKDYFDRPVILVLDEFDCLAENTINKIVGVFRDMHIHRNSEIDKNAFNKTYLLHGVALIGVRSVLGIDSKKGSPFNIQKSIHIPNLTFDEVKVMFDDYQREWGQKIDDDVVERLFYETNGQPGLVSWFGELMVEKYNKNYPQTIEMKNWKEVFLMGSQAEPNNTIMNLISKAREPEYREILTELFDTVRKTDFSFDNLQLNYLYMNGIILFEHSEEDIGKLYAKFSSPFVQKRLFNRFADELYPNMGQIIKPFENIDHIYNGKTINIQNLLRRFEQYLRQNKTWLLNLAPRRKADLQIFEAAYHFILYGWLSRFLYQIASVIPEFPTGNGKIDILIRKENDLYGIEVKSFSNTYLLQKGIKQAAIYATRLSLSEIVLAIFIESINAENRTQHEKEHLDETTNVKVFPQFIAVNE